MKTDFFDRKTELSDLKEKYSNLDSGELCLIYGRRRLGKSLLIEKFLQKIRGKSVFYFVNQTNKKELLSILSLAIFDQIGEKIKFDDWDDFFDYLYEKSAKEKFVFVMDEFPRIKDSSPDFITKFQNYWDSKLKKTKIMFVAIGSSMSMMHNIFLDRSAPLYGRMTWKMSLRPFRYVDFREMFEDLSDEKLIKIFSVFGGTPHFLWFVKKYAERPLMEIIEKTIISRIAPLREEPTNFIAMELKKENNYNAVLHAVSTSGGARSDIISISGVSGKDVNSYLDVLTELLHLIKKTNLMFYSKRNKVRYEFADNYFHFWYRFIYPNLSLIELGNMDFLRNKIEKDINEFIGKKFEEIIYELLILHNGKKIKDLKIDFTNIGPWWGKNINGAPEEIDIVASNAKTRHLIVCEVKWKNHPIDIDEIKKLIRKSDYIKATGKFHFLFVSKSGFTKRCLEFMEEKKITYLDINDISNLFNMVSGKSK